MGYTTTAGGHEPVNGADVHTLQAFALHNGLHVPHDVAADLITQHGPAGALEEVEQHLARRRRQDVLDHNSPIGRVA